MGRRKFTLEQIGQFRGILDLGWSLSRVRQHFLKSGVDISKAQLGRIKSGKPNHPPSLNPQTRGTEPNLNPSQVRSVLKQVDHVDPPTQRVLASKYNVSQSTIKRIVKKSNRRLIKKPKVHGLSADTIEKRERRSWPLYMRLKKNGWKKVVTSDEAWFYLTRMQGKRTVQYLKFGQKRDEAEVQPQQQHPKGFMVWIVFCADGFFSPIFVKPGAKINSSYYCSKVIGPWFKEYIKKYPNNELIFHQDSAPSHVSQFTLPFLESKGIRYITRDQWMPASPDAAPCDYWLWGYLKSKVIKRNVKTLSGLKRAIKEELKAIPLTMIHRALKAWPKRCRQIYYNKGGHIENFKRVHTLD